MNNSLKKYFKNLCLISSTNYKRKTDFLFADLDKYERPRMCRIRTKKLGKGQNYDDYEVKNTFRLELARKSMETEEFIVQSSWISDYVSISSDFTPILGLFSKVQHEASKEICIYQGNNLTTLEAIKLMDKSYLMRLGEQCYVDTRENLSCLARYINDCRNPAGQSQLML